VISECDLVVSWRARPRSFVALMGVYESNYLRLAALAGNLAQLAGSRISDVEGDCTLVLSVLERARYTSDLRLTYLFPDAQRPAEPAGCPICACACTTTRGSWKHAVSAVLVQNVNWIGAGPAT